MRLASPEASWLRELRTRVHVRLREQGATQAGLAAYLGITPKHMSGVLTGRANGSPDLLARLAAAAGLRIAIVDADGPRPLLPGRKKTRCDHGAPGYEQVVNVIAPTGTEG